MRRILHAQNGIELMEIEFNTEYVYTVMYPGCMLAERYTDYNAAVDRYDALTHA